MTSLKVWLHKYTLARGCTAINHLHHCMLQLQPSCSAALVPNPKLQSWGQRWKKAQVSPETINNRTSRDLASDLVYYVQQPRTRTFQGHLDRVVQLNWFYLYDIIMSDDIQLNVSTRSCNHHSTVCKAMFCCSDTDALPRRGDSSCKLCVQAVIEPKL